MAAERFTDIFQSPVARSVHIDVATGAVVEYPAAFGANSVVGNSRGGFYEDGWRHYRIFDGEAWKS